MCSGLLVSAAIQGQIGSGALTVRQEVGVVTLALERIPSAVLRQSTGWNCWGVCAWSTCSAKK